MLTLQSEKLKTLLDEDYEDDEEVADTDENMDLFEGEGTGRSKEEIVGLSNAFDIKKTSNAYFAVAVILNSRGTSSVRIYISSIGSGSSVSSYTNMDSLTGAR